MKILVLRFSSIGDIVLTTPVLRCIKNKYPEAEIHFCTKKGYASILLHNPYVSKVICLENELKPVIQEIRQTRYDYVLDLHNNLRTLMIKLRLPFSTKIYSFNKLNFQKLIAVKWKKTNALPEIHIVDRYLKTTAPLDVCNDNMGLDYFLPKDFTCGALPDGFQKDYIALVIGAQFATKQVPMNKLIELCQLSNQRKFVVIGGPEDQKRGEELATACSNVYNACGKYSLDGSAYLVSQASHVVSNDTGLMHIAAAFQKPISSLWGNTIPEFGMYPYEPQHREQITIHEVKNLSCRPCSKIGFQTCPKRHFDCMMKLDMLAVAKDFH